ncbi:MAG: hypothetical protein ACI8XV_002684 [Arenicella sp.]|jgi:hypothetical protein
MYKLKITFAILLLVYSKIICAVGFENADLPEAADDDVKVLVRFKHNIDSARQVKRSLLPQRSKSSLENFSGNSTYSDYIDERNLIDDGDPRLKQLFDLLGQSPKSNKTNHFRDANLKALTVRRSDISKLQANLNIEVFPNRWHKPMLSSSVPIVFPDKPTSDFDGSNQVVILLDTGVASNHSFLSNNLVPGSACFSNSGNPTAAGVLPSTESLCVSGAASSIGGSSGTNCSAGIFGCAHGTNMAGIIAGTNMNSSGVASGAKILSIQVGTKINDEEICGNESITPCVAVSTVDLISALDYSLSIANSQYSVASVNISLGTTENFQGICDIDPESVGQSQFPIVQPISDLRSAGVAVIAASGNGPLGSSGDSIAMSSPACVSSAIAVAATNDSDEPLNENNRSSELDFFAPGLNIMTSTLPSSTFAVTGGTSAAAAHVSAAFAVLKEKNKSLSVSTLTSILKNSGVSVSQGQITRSRIDITQALATTPDFVADDTFCIPIKTPNAKLVLVCL